MVIVSETEVDLNQDDFSSSSRFLIRFYQCSLNNLVIDQVSNKCNLFFIQT